MKKIFLLFCTLIFNPMYGQDAAAFRSSFDALSHISASANLQQTIGVTKITIEYYRPNARDREIWGTVVPYDKVWRAGANIATTIEVSDNVLINGKPLKAGKYALFVLPGKKEWTFIFDENSFQFGAFFYQGSTDALRVSVPTVKRNNKTESLLYYFDHVSYNKGELNLAWGDRSATLSIETSEDAIIAAVTDKIKDAEENNNHRAYIDASAWALDHKKMVDKIPAWLKASRDIKDTFGNNFLEARLHALNGDYDLAIKAANTTAEKFPQFTVVTESFIARWQKEL
ncbi:DUF2911 domain-containing protein [Poritiphilus flavus]|uniref:DUF2911 domain-containing protein n=1 Tax=Poritiphilus flavus TaxID=2697053 RepID=A0A6L9EB71_9FLAO|nr:DUF2911 domain-containing protein [Poritiphilus flavus]NAS11950.1 DUF2911 domain-containing protein [Poritiphilus flavus]